MRSLVGPMCGEVEGSADAIMAGTSDFDVKLAALKWKMQAVPALRESLYRPDPYTAAVDTAMLCYQMIDYFERGPGKQELGPASAEAAATCRHMTDDFMKILASGLVSGDLSRGRAFVQKWASEHPIRHSIADRESALTRTFEQQFDGIMPAPDYFADVATSVDDLSLKMDVYSNQLFRQARWEVERMKLELMRDMQSNQTLAQANQAMKSAESAAATIERLAPAIERGLRVAQDAPKLFAAERETAVNAMHEEITRTVQVLHDERVAAMEQISKERSIAMKDLNDTLAEQRQELASDADRISIRRIDYAAERIMRLLAIMVIAAAVALLSLVLALWMLLRSRSRRQRTTFSTSEKTPA
jgi:hypothetical protein